MNGHRTDMICTPIEEPRREFRHMPLQKWEKLGRWKFGEVESKQNDANWDELTKREGDEEEDLEGGKS